MVNGVEGGRQVKQCQSRNFTIVYTNNDIAMHFQKADCNELDRWLFVYMSLQPIDYYIFWDFGN